MAVGLDASYLQTLSDISKDSARTQSAQNSVGSLNSGSTEAEMKDAIKQFESFFVEKILKDMEDSAGFVDESSAMGMGGLTSYFMGNLNQKLAEQLIEQSGGRFTDTLYQQMCRNYGIDPENTAAETGIEEIKDRQE